MCRASTPLKKIPSGKPKQLNALRRKKERIEARLSDVLCRGQLIHAHILQNKLALVHHDIKDAICKEQEQREQNAVERIKSNPKFFYSYAKSLSQVKSNISMLINESRDVITDPKTLAEMLQNQLMPVFSDPTSLNIKEPDFPVPDILTQGENLVDYSSISNESIIVAYQVFRRRYSDT